MKTEAYEHADARRKNIPTSEDHVYMGDEERAGEPFSPPPAGLQGPVLLSWRRGRNFRAIRTDALPLYIHEKVSPAAFVKQLSEPAEQGAQGDLFGRFNGFAPEARYDWYHHEGNWSNRMIRGNSVDVMASLAVKEKLAGQVQMVFFDPPYGISFDSNYQPSTRKRAGAGAPVEAAPRKAFRDTYINGLHSYLDTIFSVAVHARALLAESGSFFLQMGTENVHRLSVILDEVFGAENRVATVAFAKSGATSAKHLPQVADWLLWYAKDRERVKYRQLYETLTRKEKLAHMSWHAMVELQDGSCRDLTKAEREDPDKHLPAGARLFRRMRIGSQHESLTGRSEPFRWNGTLYPCPPGEQWRVSHEGLETLAAKGRLIATDRGRLSWKRYEDEVPGRRIHNLWPEQQSPSDMHYVVETAEATVARCILMATDPGDLVLDPTCGSGTTALAAERWGRRWITIDTSAIPIALCRQRLLSAVHKWHLTLDDAEGQAREAELSGTEIQASGQSGSNPAAGFVYERVPYVSAAHLAYNRPEKPTLLFDRPLVKKGVRRISSPFTVESHSPWTYVSPSAPEDDARASERDLGIRENVMKALETGGIPIPGSASDRWHFDGIECWVDGSPDITHTATLRSGGERIALAMVPDDRAASAAIVDGMAIVAARNAFDKLVVIAFHFEAGVDREKRGKLEIVTVRANRDLTISELAASASDNAFVLIGEPDVEIERLEDGRYQARIKGYQVYDPGLGNVRPSGEACNIDCWMMDTDYDGKSFFARRIHFPDKAGDKQIKRFLRELSRRIDPQQWQYMKSLVSAPFERPRTGRIAVRIVTQYGDEMLAVLPLDPE